MKKTIEYRAQCADCNGTGIYVGMCERDGYGVVCYKCDGRGWADHIIKYDPPPTGGPIKRDDISVVLEINPGIVAGTSGDGGSAGFGGIPYDHWRNGGAFLRGTEMRGYVCPKWWAQARGGIGFEWEGCEQLRPGRRFSDCPNYKLMATCWRVYDERKEA